MSGARKQSVDLDEGPVNPIVGPTAQHYSVSLYLDSPPAPDGSAVPSLQFGAEYAAAPGAMQNVVKLIRLLCLSYLLDPARRAWLTIYDQQAENWVRPDGKTYDTPAAFPLEVTVHVGSSNLSVMGESAYGYTEPHSLAFQPHPTAPGYAKWLRDGKNPTKAKGRG